MKQTLQISKERPSLPYRMGQCAVIRHFGADGVFALFEKEEA